MRIGRLELRWLPNRLQRQIDQTKAEAATAYKGSGLCVNVYGKAMTDAAAIATLRSTPTKPLPAKRWTTVRKLLRFYRWIKSLA